MADSVTEWPLAHHNPLPYWQRGNIILIGDAAHPVRTIVELLREASVHWLT
jgi:2-polyprenyl-6-methoxyphenol hydroxylase-like FAD-dependent oxidoreductase